MAVLVIAREEDLHTKAVVREIQRLGGDSLVADLSEFPQFSQMNIRYSSCGDRIYELNIREMAYDLAHFGSVWWRRPQLPQISNEIVSETYRLFAVNEASEALAGLWHALDVFWVNDPAKDQVAHRKVTQLRVAQDCGFRVPDTLITNDPAWARVFIDQHGYRDVVYKSFSALENAWRETRILRSDEISMIESVKYAPVIFQEYVKAEYDLRITVVGNNIYPAAIHSQQTSYPTDFRMDMENARTTSVELPAEVQVKITNFMKTLGLQYGAIDMRKQPDGGYVFLEINPAGQWLFIEEKTGQPIAASLAELLVENDRQRDQSPVR
jgi:glutathione synthase/RimK-type ligase-like ATP-grasp enzyme